MGRRKIEIKAIKDDRNRSVTFLKRKGGLFKKAHELSVLCSVDVAVIIFGHNKKLYEFSSGDINETLQRYQYYGGPHERKGPADFAGKDNDDDEEDPDDAAVEEQLNEQQNGPVIHHPQAYPVMRPRASASPPNGNGLLPHHYRQHTPQPHPGSRPTSRNHNPIPRPNSTLGHAPHPPNGYAYMGGPHNGHMQGQHPGTYPSQHHPQQFQGYPQHPPPMQYVQPEPRRASMPPYAQQQGPQIDRGIPQVQTMKVERHSPSPPQIQEPQPQQTQHLQPQAIRSMAPKGKSIFTPIDTEGSLAASWGMTASKDDRRQESVPKSRSPEDTAKMNAATAGRPQFAAPERTQSMSSAGGTSQRPRLNLKIPNEHSEDESGPTGTSSPQQSGDTGGSAAQTKSSEPASTSHSGVILPPPSPSTLLSASATGPPNPFARPLPPGAPGSIPYQNSNAIETPISALPSRFLSENMGLSPIYPDWGFSRSGGGDGNILPSPLTFPTPGGFGALSREGEAGAEGPDRKRKTPEADTPGGIAASGERAGKKVKAAD